MEFGSEDDLVYMQVPRGPKEPTWQLARNVPVSGIRSAPGLAIKLPTNGTTTDPATGVLLPNRALPGHLGLGLFGPTRFEASPYFAYHDTRDGFATMWLNDPDTGLSFPIEVLDALTFEREHAMGVYSTPSLAGLPAPTPALDELAWAVLTRCDPHYLAYASYEAAGYLEALSLGGYGGPRWRRVSEAIVRQMTLPRPLAANLLSHVRAGRPLLDLRIQRWLTGEATAAIATKGWEPRTLRPGSEAHVLARALGLRSVLVDSTPSPGEVITAIWLLQEGFRFTDDVDPAEDVLTSLSMLAMGTTSPTAWLATLTRWHTILSTPETDPSVRRSPVRPRRIRAELRGVLGCTLDEWMSGAFALCAMQQTLWDGGTGNHLDLLVPPHEGDDTIRLTDTFRRAVIDHMCATPSDLGTAIISDPRSTYQGVGTLSTADSTPMRNSPILTDGRHIVASSLDRLASRAATIVRTSGIHHRIGLPGNQINQTLGDMFEAYVIRCARTLARNRTVLGPEQIDAVLGTNTRRADLIIVDSDTWLVVEASLQTLNRDIAAGGADEVRRVCEQYHRKADQIDATTRHLGRLAEYYGLLRPRRVARLVVTDQSLLPSGHLWAELRRLRPDRPPKFVCGIDEFERLVALDRAGYNGASLVDAWQTNPGNESLAIHLHRASRWLPTEYPLKEDSERLLRTALRIHGPRPQPPARDPGPRLRRVRHARPDGPDRGRPAAVDLDPVHDDPHDLLSLPEAEVGPRCREQPRPRQIRDRYRKLPEASPEFVFGPVEGLPGGVPVDVADPPRGPPFGEGSPPSGERFEFGVEAVAFRSVFVVVEVGGEARCVECSVHEPGHMGFEGGGVDGDARLAAPRGVAGVDRGFRSAVPVPTTLGDERRPALPAHCDPSGQQVRA